MEDAKIVLTRMFVGTKFTKNEEESDQGTSISYLGLIRTLNYLVNATRPDMAYVVSHLSQFNSCFQEQHWKAAKRVLKYLK